MDFFLEYWLFDGHLTLLQGLWDLVSFSELSHWKMVFLGFLMGFVLKKFYTKQWWGDVKNSGLVIVPVAIFVSLFILTDSYTKDNKSHLYDIKEKVRVMDYDYDQWRNKNPKGTVNPEWKKEREYTRKEIAHYRDIILVKLSNQSFFLLFLIVGFLYKKYTIRNTFHQIKSEWKTISREADEKKEREKNRIESEKRRAENERRAEELRAKQLEEKRLNIELEKERTKQIEAESSVKLKKLDVERPEKEEKLSKILDKLDDL